MEQDMRKEKLNALFTLIASLDSPEDCRALFEDLCTVKELENITGQEDLLDAAAYEALCAEEG